jgi:hypothetical protein
MIKARHLALAALLAPMTLALGACNKRQSDKQAAAGGEILPGSASDALLPLDTVTSAPPLAPKVVKASGVTASEAPDAAAPADAPADPAAQPEG